MESVMEIRSDIEPPPAVGKYPWFELNVGESFFAPVTGNNNLSGARKHAEERTGRKFRRRRVVENGITGLRVWRVE
jgi:hypothetical protein